MQLGNWKSFIVGRKSYIDLIEARLKKEKAKYARDGKPIYSSPSQSAPDEAIYSMMSQSKLDELSTLSEIKNKKSKGHISWVMTKNGLYEYFLGPKESLYLAPVSNALDADGYRAPAKLEITGISRVLALLKIYNIEIPPNFPKSINILHSKNETSIMPTTLRYDKPFKYNKAADAYIVTIRKPAKGMFGIYEITLSHGDRARPHGFILTGQRFSTFLFEPRHSGSYAHGRMVGSSTTLAEAVLDVRKAWEAVALPRG